MTILARSGLPGLAIWALLIVTWLWTMVSRIYLARIRGDAQWSRLLIFVMCYWVGVIVDSSFDVALEGPMIGILFWVLFGTGIGLSMTYDALCRERFAQHRANGSVW
jgi:O-antigen ligase